MYAFQGAGWWWWGGGGSEVGETAESGVGTLKKKMFTVDST